MVRHNCVYCDLMSDLVAQESTDLRGTINVLASHVIHSLDVDAADVLVYDAAAQRLVNAGGRGFRGRGMENVILRLEDTPAGKAVANNEVVRVANVTRAQNDFAHLADLAGEDMVAYVAAPLVLNAQVKGVLEIWSRRPINASAQWLDTLEQTAEKGAMALSNVMLVRRLQRANLDLAQAYDATIEAWSQALELRGYETKSHIQRVADMSVDFARLIGLGEAEVSNIRRGARLHDIGMLAIPERIVLKPEALDEEELVIMRRHPMVGYQQLESVEFLKSALDIVRYHHEKWDGTGYPYGLKGEQIPLTARLFALVDVWDSLRSDRPFRKGWPEEKVKAHIRERAGKQFDPDLADRFLKLLEGAKRKQTESERGSNRGYNTESFVT